MNRHVPPPLPEAGADHSGLRVLLLAYEFPPSPSPQSLRWHYLTRELARMGVRVRVIAPGLAGHDGRVEVAEGVEVIRVFPGWFKGGVESLRKVVHLVTRRRAAPATQIDTLQARHEDGPDEARGVTINWKGRLVERVQDVIARFRFPDARAEWNVPARRIMERELDSFRPHWVITSHEPASVLALGLHAKSMGCRWLADLGDPVLAPYTPRRWHRRARRLERLVCARADQVVVTTEATRSLLVARHGVAASRLAVITQGFDAERIPERARAVVADRGQGAGDACLRLVYTGSFYPFRSPAELLGAIESTPGVEIQIASHTRDEQVLAASRRTPDRIRFLGAVSTAEAQRLQEGADVLVDLGNEDPVQVPGKLYEYLGALRPILHIGNSASAGAVLVERLSRGWACPGSEQALVAKLEELVERKRGGRLEGGLDLSSEAIMAYSWQRAAETLAGLLLSRDRR